MNKIQKPIIFIGSCLVLLLSACSFEKTNTDRFGVTEEMTKRDGIAVGAKLTAMQTKVLPVGTAADGTEIVNQYQIGVNISTDALSGYFGYNAGWNGNSHIAHYNLIGGWVNAVFRNSYSAIYPSWKEMKATAEKLGETEGVALAQILKVSAWHRATDQFGPIPYTKAGNDDFSVPYDSQEVVYQAMMDDLEAAVRQLKPAADAGRKLYGEYDAVYAGDMSKWIRYANTLMLRLALRMSNVDPAKAQRYAEQAVHAPYGVMQSPSDEAKLEKGAGLQFRNNIYILAHGQYKETMMSMDMFSYLANYSDPRIKIYYQPAKESATLAVALPYAGASFMGLPRGFSVGQSDEFEKLSYPNVTETSPTYWMRASEAYFLRAEAALRGWNMGATTEVFYRYGILCSFLENGLSQAEADTYWSQTAGGNTYQFSGSSFAPLTSKPVAMTASDSNDSKLEQIMIQKWIALYPNGLEAWCDVRRTGLPKLYNPVVNKSGGLIPNDVGVRRFVYSMLQTTSEADKQQATQLLGGSDLPTTRLWWDVANRPAL